MRVRQVVLDAIAAHARRDSPHECCGLLIGTSTEIIEAVAATNVADDPDRRYEISPAEYLVQIRRCRDAARTGNAPLIIHGGYHSHPHSPPAPSPTDLEQAFEEFLYLIVGPVEGEAATGIRAYRLRNGQFEAEELIVV
jgi:proteasome lid subunit RPN8/RPN11